MSYDILIIDDEADIRNLIAGILNDEGYNTRVASDDFSALDQIKNRQPNLIILDVWLGNSEYDGIKILEIIKRDHPFVPVIMISGHSTIETAVNAIKIGAYDFIEKPFKSERLLLVVEKAIESSRLKRENHELKIRARLTSALIGTTPSIQQIRQTVDRLSQNNSRTFITGPVGSGKESIAREIHNRSKRSINQFIVVKCAEIHPNQLEVELFGVDIAEPNHNTPRKIGLIEEAHGGTLYFDEVTQIPLPIQNKIVRLLQEQNFSRVGGQKKINVDVRFMAGSHENVHQLISDGHFREDLFYRLSVTHMQIPSLSERLIDLPVIVSHLVEEASKSQGLIPRRFTDEAMTLLQAYEWPGDIQQLRNVIDWILLMSSQDARQPIGKETLPKEILSGNSFINNWQNKSAEIVVMPLREAREAFEREYLLAQVNRFSGNISQTARFIGMERSALHRKLRVLGVHEPKSVKPHMGTEINSN